MRLGCIFMSLNSILDDTDRNKIKELNREEIAELLENRNVKAFLLFMYENKDISLINYSKLLHIFQRTIFFG